MPNRHLVNVVYTSDMGVTVSGETDKIEEYLDCWGGGDYSLGFQVEMKGVEVVDETGEVVGYIISTPLGASDGSD
jgi:hypothetical protein